jgi:hypothetical protein
MSTFYNNYFFTPSLSSLSADAGNGRAPQPKDGNKKKAGKKKMAVHYTKKADSADILVTDHVYSNVASLTSGKMMIISL